jgi:GMP synthase (glutamine-hydrolysing)
MKALDLIVLDAYAPEGRTALRDAGGTEAGELYRRMLENCAREAELEVTVEILYPADPRPDLPTPSELRERDGMAWTGSSLTILRPDDPRVRNQVEFARQAFVAGVPSFGSCWAAQLAVVAGGGRCAQSPRGREFGIAREIQLTTEGKAHPLFEGKAARYDGFTSHQDEVTQLCDGSSILASNEWSRVQAVSVDCNAGRFWAVQYHPEYDLHEVASLCRLRKSELVTQGVFEDATAANFYIDCLEGLHRSPHSRDLAEALQVGEDLLDEKLRTRETLNWLRSL